MEWDISTITAADYTVEMPIDERFYNSWYQDHYLGSFGDSKYGFSVGYSFKSLLKRVIENRVTQYKEAHPHELNGDENVKTQIVDIVLSCNNHEIIKLLKKRGKLISKMKFAKVEKINAKINDYAKKWQITSRPLEAFITFNTEEDHSAALKLGEEGFEIYGKHRVTFSQAPEPTDIIWENRTAKNTDERIAMRRTIVFFSMCCIILVIFWFALKLGT